MPSARRNSSGALRTIALPWLAVALLALPLAPARASLEDEIQVYLDDLNDAGQLNLQLHLNTTPSGTQSTSYPGETVNAGGKRITGEFAYGITRDLEAGLYLPVVVQRWDDTSLAGLKLRLKWVPVRPADGAPGLFAGVNGELARVARRYDQAEYGFELRPILGWHGKDWLIAVNPVLDFGLRAPEVHRAPEFQPSYKVSHDLAPGIATGLEYYTDLGQLWAIEPVALQQHMLFWAVDVDRAPWNLNVGIGRGLTHETDAWTIKMIINVPSFW